MLLSSVFTRKQFLLFLRSDPLVFSTNCMVVVNLRRWSAQHHVQGFQIRLQIPLMVILISEFAQYMGYSEPLAHRKLYVASNDVAKRRYG